jgi:DprA winged helix domain
VRSDIALHDGDGISGGWPGGQCSGEKLRTSQQRLIAPSSTQQKAKGLPHVLRIDRESVGHVQLVAKQGRLLVSGRSAADVPQEGQVVHIATIVVVQAECLAQRNAKYARAEHPLHRLADAKVNCQRKRGEQFGESGVTSGLLIAGHIFLPRNCGKPNRRTPLYCNMIGWRGAHVRLNSRVYHCAASDQGQPNPKVLAEVQAVFPEDPTEAALFALVDYQPQHVDELRRQSELPITVVSATLALLELKGLIRQTGAMQYVLAREEQEEYAVSRQ